MRELRDGNMGSLPLQGVPGTWTGAGPCKHPHEQGEPHLFTEHG